MSVGPRCAGPSRAVALTSLSREVCFVSEDYQRMPGSPMEALSKMRIGWLAVVVVVTCLPAAGCGESHATVHGTLKRADGTPLKGARVICRSPETGVTASGRTDANGHYELGVLQPGDGVPAGEYYVVIAENLGAIDNPRPRTINGKYQSASHSGLKLELNPGETREYSLTLEAP